MEGIIAMNKKQRQLYQLATEVIRNKLSVKEFSLWVGKSYRQARRIVVRVRQRDALGVIHGNAGKNVIHRLARSQGLVKRPKRRHL